MKNRYDPQAIESKWQKKWLESKLYSFNPAASGKKFYTLVELPYTSGDLHIGHWFTFTTPDAYSRFLRMKGYNVFFPHGYDTIGLPAENAAIKRGIHPRDWTMKNIETMAAQFRTMGSIIDLDHAIITCSDDYFKWNQWIFIKMFEKGICYRGKATANWCPVDKTVLADEHVEAGKCWRCGATVEKKEVEQWFLRITKYADQLIWPKITPGVIKANTPGVQKKTASNIDWPTSVMTGQNNWIGKSEGVLIEFKVQSSKFKVPIFTTRPETTDGATFVVLAPDLPLVAELVTNEQKKAVETYLKQVEAKSEQERKEHKDKTGVFTGSYVTNPVTKKKIPVWVADYVLMGYGTGAIMAVPDADERDEAFAKKFDLPIVKTSHKAVPKGEKKITYHIRDWSVSRQRYWGTPVPMIHCPDCGIVPVPEKDLPVTLPYDVDFTPTGKPPLATNEKWLKVKCPKCKGGAQRDPETLDTFFDSAWYYYRYLSPDYDKAPFDKLRASRLMPVDVYFGGAEHTLGHTLYARFFTKFFKDLGLVGFDEFALKRVQHGVVLGADGNKMSKSRGNVINPDEVVKEYGVDTVRLYLCFMMPYESTAPWATGAIAGMYRFLTRVWQLHEKIDNSASLSTEDKVWLNKTIQRVEKDVNEITLNTAIAALMEWLNYLSKKSRISDFEFRIFLLLLAPFAPHITEELWEILQSGERRTKNGKLESIHQEKWPEYDEKYLAQESVNIPVQVDGKLRGVVPAAKDAPEQEVVQRALASKSVSKHLGRDYKQIYVPGKILSFVTKK